MKLTQLLSLLAGAATTLQSAYSTKVDFTEVEVRAGKDASPFMRGLDTEEGPKSLVLKEENLFISVDGNATLDNGEPLPAGTVIQWSIDAGGNIFEQADVEVEGGEGVFSLRSDFGIGEEVNWVKVPNRGTAVITVYVSIPAIGNDTALEVSEDAEVFSISAFESIFPLLALVVLSILSRNVYVAMFFGIWIGSLIIVGGDVAESFRQLFDVHMIPSLIDEYNFRTVTFTLFLSGFITLIKRSGGQEGFSILIAKFATSAKKTQLAAVAAGVGLFFDDYSSALIIGSSFKRLTDNYYVSREKLAFVVDATSAPIASLAPISSWIAFELSRIKPELDQIKATSQFPEAQDLPGEYTFFLNTIPSRYYPIFMLIIQVVLISFGVEFGPMLYAERKTRIDRRKDGGEGASELTIGADPTDPEPDTPRKAYNFIVPLGFFIVTLLLSMVNIGKNTILADFEENGAPGEKPDYSARNIFGSTDSFYALVYTTMGASLFALAFYLLQTKEDGHLKFPKPQCIMSAVDCRLKKVDDLAKNEDVEIIDQKDAVDNVGKARPLMYFTESINIWVEGFKNLVPAILILCMAFTIKSIVKGAATDRFFTDIILNGNLGAEYLPTIIFFVSGLLALCTGTSYGTMSIMFPLVSFATFEKSEGDIKLFTVAMSSIMAGAVFGDHSSLISDTTILSSIGSGCTIGAHVYTQMPYALWGALFSMIVGTLPAGAGVDSVVVLIFGGLALAVMTVVMSAPIVSRSGRLDRFSELYLKIRKSESMEAFKEKTRKFAAENENEVDEEPLMFLKQCCTCWRGVRRSETPVVDEETPEAEPVKVEAEEVAVVKDEPKDKHDL